MRSSILVAAALLTGTASTVSAQDLSVTPFIGEMIPLNTMLIDTAGSSYYKIAPQTIYGLRITKTMSPTLALQLQGGIGKGDFEAASGSTQIILGTTTYFLDARARLRLLGNDATNLGVIGGAGWTQFRVGLFDVAHESDPNTKMAGRATGIVGVGVKAHLTGDASFTADLTDRIHEQTVEAPGLSSGLIKPTQHDLTMTFGLNFPVGH